MKYDNILIEEHGNIALLIINRPKKLNALNKRTIKELHRALDKLDHDEETRVILITGSENKAFVAGADISEFADFNIKQGSKLAKKGHEILFDFLENLSTPVIALINGYALGGGLELAMACHLRLGSENAKMGLPEVTLGLIPGYGGTQRLAQLVGKGKAMEMIMTASMINAEDAKNYGLLNYVLPQDELIGFGFELAKKIAKNSSSAISFAIETINAGYRKDLNGFQEEIKNFGNCFGTDDFIEGTTAFLEKRKPDFK